MIMMSLFFIVMAVIMGVVFWTIMRHAPPPTKAKKQKGSYDSLDAGLRDLVETGRLEEAAEIYRKFAGVDEYTAQDAIDQLAHEIRNEKAE